MNLRRLRECLKPTVRAVQNRLRFSGAQVGSSTFISRGCRLGAGAVIGCNCNIFQSSLDGKVCMGDRVTIGEHSRLGASVLGEGCHLESHDELFNSRLDSFVYVQRGCTLNELTIGRYSYIARGTYLNDVRIGSFASIGPDTLMGFGDHPHDFVSTAPVFYSTRGQCGTTFAQDDRFEERKPIELGNDVWIGARVFVRDGVKVGHGAIVAAGAVVTRDVLPYSIVGGVPAKLIRFRFSPEIIERLLVLKWWDWSVTRLRQAQRFFAHSDIRAFLQWAES